MLSCIKMSLLKNRHSHIITFPFFTGLFLPAYKYTMTSPILKQNKQNTTLFTFLPATALGLYSPSHENAKELPAPNLLFFSHSLILKIFCNFLLQSSPSRAAAVMSPPLPVPACPDQAEAHSDITHSFPCPLHECAARGPGLLLPSSPMACLPHFSVFIFLGLYSF